MSGAGCPEYPLVFVGATTRRLRRVVRWVLHPQISPDALKMLDRPLRFTASGWVAPDGSWDHAHLSVTLSDSMYSVRRIIGDDWDSPSLSEWSHERASLEIDYTAYGQPIPGLATDPWTDADDEWKPNCECAAWIRTGLTFWLQGYFL
jgi:hypothetical protein